MRRKPKEKKVTLWFTLFLVALMVFSFGGYLFGDSPSKVEYNGFTFKADQGGYLLEVGENPVAFSYFPGDLESLDFPQEAKMLLSGRPMFYVTYFPGAGLAQEFALAQFRMQSALSYAGVYVQPAMDYSGSVAEEEYSALPQVGCANATLFVPVILFNGSESSQSGVSLDGYCLVVSADGKYAAAAYSERIIYSVLGVMQ